MGPSGDPNAPQTAQDYITVSANSTVSITYAIK
jgi:hypothetical protein